MEAKDTVMDIREIKTALKIPNHLPLSFEADSVDFERAVLAQAVISFKAGMEQEHRAMVGVAVDEGNEAYKAGLRKVVEFIKENRETPLGKDQYGYYIWESKLQAKLKEWGL